MQISEAKLNRIIREEVALQVIKQTISEVVLEMHLNLTEQQTLLFEETVLDQIKKAAKKYALPIWAVAALGFGSELLDRESMEAEATAMAASKIKRLSKLVENMNKRASMLLRKQLNQPATRARFHQIY